jgi:hypothetical protein
MFVFTDNRIALCMGVIIGMCLLGAFVLWRWQWIKRGAALSILMQPENVSWVESNCTTREKQAVYNLLFGTLNDYDKTLLLKVAKRAPSVIAGAIEAQGLGEGL